MANVVIYGNGSFAQLLCYYIKNYTNDKVIAYAADKKFIQKEKLDDLPVIDFDYIKDLYPPTHYKIIVAIGYSSMRNRTIMYNKSKSLGYKFYSFICPSSIVDKSAVLGDNLIIFSGVIVEPFCTIHSNNVIWSGSVVCHNSTIEQHCFIAANSTIGGDCHIGENSFIGFNACVTQQLTLDRETLVGASSTLTRSTKAYGKYIGSPAHLVGEHQANGIII